MTGPEPYRGFIRDDGSPEPLDLGERLPMDAYVKDFNVVAGRAFESISSQVSMATSDVESKGGVDDKLTEEYFKNWAKYFVGRGKRPMGINIGVKSKSAWDSCRLYVYGELVAGGKDRLFDESIEDVKKRKEKEETEKVTSTIKETSGLLVSRAYGVASAAPKLDYIPYGSVIDFMPTGFAGVEQKRQSGVECTEDIEHTNAGYLYRANVRLHGVLVLRKSKTGESEVRPIQVAHGEKDVYLDYISSEERIPTRRRRRARDGDGVGGPAGEPIGSKMAYVLGLIEESGNAKPMDRGGVSPETSTYVGLMCLRTFTSLR